MAKINPYNYVVIKHNNPYFERESVLTPNGNKYKPKAKYAAITKMAHKDGSESIAFITYSNDLELLQSKAAEYPSWYNYPLGLSKNMQGYIRELS